MQPLVYTNTYEVFLVLERFSSSFDKFITTTAQLDVSKVSPILGVDVYYRHETDVALLGLRFERKPSTRAAIKRLSQRAGRLDMPLLDPSRLGEGDQHTFYRSYLQLYRAHVEDGQEIRDALMELGYRLDLVKERTRPSEKIVRELIASSTPTPVKDRASMYRLSRQANKTPPGGQRTSPYPNVSNPARKRRRAELTGPHRKAPRRSRGVSNHARSLPRVSLAEQAAAARTRAKRKSSRSRVVDHEQVTKAELHAARGKNKPRARTNTLPATPNARSERVAAVGSGSHEAISPIEVRFVRGDRWLAGRLATLSSKSAYIITTAPLRVGDLAHVAIEFNRHTAMVYGNVHHVTTPEDATQAGIGGFSVVFANLHGKVRADFLALLHAARKSGVRLTRPPQRKAIRFPVAWPVRISTPREGFRANALDMSTGGMFVATDHNIDTRSDIRLPLDTGGAPIQGTALVVRQVTDAMANSRGLSAGYGLQLDLEHDADRYQQLLLRVQLRADKRILIGASPERLQSLSNGLSAVGYSTAGASDPTALARLTTTPADIAIVDTSLVQGVGNSWVRRVFTSRNITCLSTNREPVENTRATVDNILRVTS